MCTANTLSTGTEITNRMTNSPMSLPNVYANPPAPRTRGADRQALACWRSVLSVLLDFIFEHREERVDLCVGCLPHGTAGIKHRCDSEQCERTLRRKDHVALPRCPLAL